MLPTIVNEILNKKVLLCFPHPDDEIYIAGNLLQWLSTSSVNYRIVCLSQGGAGKNFSKKLESIKDIRRNEFYSALNYLGVKNEQIIIYDFEDSKFKEQTEEISSFINNYIKKEGIGTIITFDNTGLTGHPDHITLSKILFGISKELNLVLFVPTRSKFENHFHKGTPKSNLLNIPTHEFKANLIQRYKKYMALFKHVSQFNTLSFRLKMLWIFLINKELFHKIEREKSYNYEYTDYKI